MFGGKPTLPLEATMILIIVILLFIIACALIPDLLEVVFTLGLWIFAAAVVGAILLAALAVAA